MSDTDNKINTFSIHLPITNLLVMADLPTPPTPITMILSEVIAAGIFFFLKYYDSIKNINDNKNSLLHSVFCCDKKFD